MWRGFDVTFVQNVTDVDDKIIKRACEEGRSARRRRWPQEYTAAFIEDMRAVRRAGSGYSPEGHRGDPRHDRAYQASLIEGGHAYEVEGDVYFSVRSVSWLRRSCPGATWTRWKAGIASCAPMARGWKTASATRLDFAAVEGRQTGRARRGNRPGDQGRPGWHIECSAMSRKYLGPAVRHPRRRSRPGVSRTTRTSGRRARRRAAARSRTTGCTAACCRSTHEKMSKSLGNFMLLHDVLEPGAPAGPAHAHAGRRITAARSTFPTSAWRRPTRRSRASRTRCAAWTGRSNMRRTLPFAAGHARAHRPRPRGAHGVHRRHGRRLQHLRRPGRAVHVHRRSERAGGRQDRLRSPTSPPSSRPARPSWTSWAPSASRWRRPPRAGRPSRPRWWPWRRSGPDMPAKAPQRPPTPCWPPAPRRARTSSGTSPTASATAWAALGLAIEDTPQGPRVSLGLMSGGGLAERNRRSPWACQGGGA